MENIVLGITHLLITKFKKFASRNFASCILETKAVGKYPCSKT